MREIEFRVWDKSAKFYILLDDKELFLNNNGLYERKTVPYMGDEYNNVSDQYILEQYTGLKDKNGVKVFEGDIVSGFNNRMIVFYHDTRAMFALDYITDNATGKIAAPYDDWCEYTVIGNIHQHPELLKQTAASND